MQGQGLPVFREHRAQAGAGQAAIDFQLTETMSQDFGIVLVTTSSMMSMQQWWDLKSVAKTKLVLGLGESVLEFLSASRCLLGVCYSVICFYAW